MAASKIGTGPRFWLVGSALEISDFLSDPPNLGCIVESTAPLTLNMTSFQTSTFICLIRR
jgi:hypothetical protein